MYNIIIFCLLSEACLNCSADCQEQREELLPRFARISQSSISSRRISLGSRLSHNAPDRAQADIEPISNFLVRASVGDHREDLRSDFWRNLPGPAAGVFGEGPQFFRSMIPGPGFAAFSGDLLKQRGWDGFCAGISAEPAHFSHCHLAFTSHARELTPYGCSKSSTKLLDIRHTMSDKMNYVNSFPPDKLPVLRRLTFSSFSVRLCISAGRECDSGQIWRKAGISA